MHASSLLTLFLLFTFSFAYGESFDSIFETFNYISYSQHVSHEPDRFLSPFFFSMHIVTDRGYGSLHHFFILYILLHVDLIYPGILSLVYRILEFHKKKKKNTMFQMSVRFFNQTSQSCRTLISLYTFFNQINKSW